MDPLVTVFICAGLIGLNAYRFYVGVRSSHSLLPYQAGIIYKRGRPMREVGPGCHRVMLGSEKILFLDRRPVKVNAENRLVILSDGSAVIYSFEASAEVRDVKRVLYSSALYSHMPAFVTVCVTRGILNQARADNVLLGRVLLEQRIFSACMSRLEVAGFTLQSFHFTRLEIAKSLRD
jgi:hypothetical protein